MAEEETANGPETATSAGRRAAAIADGIMTSMTKDLPKLIIAVGAALGMAVAGYDHFKEKADTGEVWKHSGKWTERMDAEDVAISNLNAEVQEMKQQRNKETK